MPETLTADDYGQLYQMLTANDAAVRAAGLKMSAKLTPEEAQQFFDFQHTVNKPDLEQRRDSNMLTVGGVGVSPEMALGVGQAGRAIVGAASAGGVVAGARAAVAQASPVVKYELAKSALTAMGVPGPLAAVAAMGVSGYTGRGAKTTTATPAAAEAATVPGTGTAWTPGETPPINATYRVVRPPAGPEPPPPTTTGATPGPTPPMQTSYRVVEPPPPAAPPPARPQTATGTSWTPGAAPPAEPPPAPPAPVQSAPPPVQPAPAPAAPPAPVTPQAAQGALVMAAARAKIPLTKAELEAMVPHVVAGNTPDDVLAALVKLRQAPVASPAAEGAAARPAQVDVAGNVTPSRSRREMSATPGLTKSDVQDLGLNPDLPIKKLTPDLITRIMRNRAQRAALYRSDAAYKKSVDAMAASERD